MSDQFLGEIRPFSFNFAPRAWALCQGQLMPINQNQALFSLLGTYYGGDGTRTFGLPDLRGRTPIGSANPGTFGEIAGVETVTLNANQLPVHTHALKASSTTANLNTPAAANSLASNAFYAAPASQTQAMNKAALGSTAASLPHNNLQPTLVINYCIALSGVFPSRS
jgi:microcystin-dependent protein